MEQNKLSIFGEKHSKLCDKLRKDFKYYPDYPKKGILFWDLFTLLKNESSFLDLMTLVDAYADTLHDRVDAVMGIESKGLIFGVLIAKRLCKPFIPVKKVGKLAGETLKASYDLEYGTDTVEVQKDCIGAGKRVVVVDDVIATGGTMAAACKLAIELKAEIVECFVIITLLEANGIDKLSAPVNTIFVLDSKDELSKI